MEEKRRNTMGTTEKKLAKLNTSTEYNTWLVKRDSLIFVKKELPLSQYDTMKTFYSLQEKTPSPFPTNFRENVLIFFKEIFQCKISYFLLG
mgnify:CR=1 FL=1